MELFGTLEDWFNSLTMRDNIFPHNHNYLIDYPSFSGHLNTWVHPFVNTGAMIRDGGILTDHGPEHIKKVILRASQLVQASKCNLTEYEVFILLMAIHIHDIGNIKKRNGHEFNSLKVLEEIGVLKGRDRLEWDAIFDVAEAHGGDPKDKIDELQAELVLNHMVNKPLLAAILKFADELAEDRTRANRYELIYAKSIPPKSEIFHRYAHCLHSVGVDVNAKQVSLLFDVEEADLKREFVKVTTDEDGQEHTTTHYLIEEIYERTHKTHLERTYCSKFLREGGIEINVVRVTITINMVEQDSRMRSKKIKISYDLGEKGYPTMVPNEIYMMCPRLKEHDGLGLINKLEAKELTDVSC